MKREDYEAAIRMLQPLAVMGDSGAQFWLGQMHAFGWGMPRDENEALRWLRRSARWTKTEPDRAAVAAYDIGRDYAEGVGAVHKDEAEAVRWFKIAAESGSREAAERLGAIYTEGTLGVRRDPKEAQYWLNKARAP